MEGLHLHGRVPLKDDTHTMLSRLHASDLGAALEQQFTGTGQPRPSLIYFTGNCGNVFDEVYECVTITKTCVRPTHYVRDHTTNCMYNVYELN